MERILRLLAVEDAEDDCALLLRELRRNGYAPDCLRVETREAMSAALDEREWDLIVSDYALPQFSAPEALALMLDKGLDLPFIIVSGAVGEERAVAALKAGAHDFIRKDLMSRLVPAIGRELPAAAERRARRRAEAEVLDLYDNAPCGYHSLDKSGRIARINETELKWLGCTREELVGVKAFADLLTERSRAAFRERFERLKSGGPIRDLEIDMTRKDGSVFPALLSSSAVLDKAGNFLMSRSIVHDNSAHKRHEEQVRLSQKLDAIGKFAGGVARDFNVMLDAILLHSQAALQSLKPGDPLRQTLGLIHETGKQAAELTRLLLAFGGRQALDAKAVELYYVVSGMEKMLRRLASDKIALHTRLDAAGTRVKLDRERIEQIVMILFENASDAMPAGGTLTIETALVKLDAEYCRTHPAIVPGDYARLTVSDTGAGIDEDIMPYIFEPFFTTKEQGKGAGLGLSAVYGLVTQTGGSIGVASSVGQGTTFKLYLPRVSDPSAPNGLDS